MKEARAKSDKATRSQPVVTRAPSQGVLDQSRVLFLIVAATVLAYANSLGGAFVFDDTKQIAGNPALRSWSNILRAFTSDVWSFQRGTLTKDIPPPYYRPLFTAYLTLNYQLFGLWEPGWHLINLLVHSGATVAVFFLIKRLSGDRLMATLAALLFGLHPAHVESISWISGIPDPLAALFCVPGMIWYVRYRTEGDRRFLIASVIAYGLSALCKETPLALPLVFVVWELTRAGNRERFSPRGREIILQLVPYAMIAGVYLASIGFCYLIAILLVFMARRQKQPATAVAAAIIVAFGASTFVQNRLWHDAVSLWQRAVYYSPNSWSTHYNLGLAYLNLKQNQAAIAELAEANHLNPREPIVLNNLGLAYGSAGDTIDGIAILKKALELDPTLIEAH